MKEDIIIDGVFDAAVSALRRLKDGWQPRQYDRAVDLVAMCSGAIVCVGMGKSALPAQKAAAGLATLGRRAFALDPADAGHGTLGLVQPDDVVLCYSKSGETAETVHAVRAIASRYPEVPVVVVTAEAGSALASLGDVVVPIWRGYEGWQPSAPMASVIAMMAVSDALVAACGERMGVRDEDIRRRHPAGAIGRAVA